ncbi:MAG: hypothetical protein ACOCW1_00120 [Chitinispirillaceae bacterium]
MNFKLIYISRFSVILLLWTVINGGPLDGNYSSYGLPLSLFHNPSLLTNQVGYPAAFQIRFSREEKINAKGSFVVPLENSGLSFGYEHGEKKEKLSTGFGHRTSLVDFGSAFDFHFRNREPELSVRAALAKKVNNQTVSLVAQNIVVSRRDSSIAAGFSLAVNGPFSNFKNLNYDLSLYSFFDESFSRINDLGGICRINFSSVKPLIVDLSTGFEISHRYRKGLEFRYFFSLGAYTFLKPALAGIHAWYEKENSSNRDELTGAVYFNPVQKLDRTPPKVALNYKKDSSGGYYFSIECEESEEESGIRSWILVISSTKKDKGPLLKAFSGGSVAPSVIHWDGKNSAGAVVNEKKVYVKLSAIDKEKNMASTDWLEVKLSKN